MIRKIKLMLLHKDGKYMGQAVDITVPVISPCMPIDGPACIYSIEFVIEETPPRIIESDIDPFKKKP